MPSSLATAPVGTYTVIVQAGWRGVDGSLLTEDVSWGFTTATAQVVGGSSDSRCFIPTAACGSSSSGDVMTLRQFRDDVRLRLPGGHAPVETYYELSPPVAKWIAER
ncbi:MAG: hypothetical protein IPM29_09335 [Planctomycetes bacterium]|nr:hypothetical protein [Planctomycetota bacterium]